MKNFFKIIWICILLSSCIRFPKNTIAEKNQIIDSEGIDTIPSPYNEDNKIYITNRTFVYQVYQNNINRKYNFIIELKVIPGSCNSGQTKIKYKYFYRKEELTPDEIIAFEYSDSLGGYCRQEITGVIENNIEIWLHPPRTKTLIKLEKAPFPEIKFNSKEWNETLVIPFGNYKEIGLSGSIIKWNYKIDSIKYIHDTIPYYCSIKAVATSKKGGRNTLDAVFKADSGMVKLNYFFEDKSTVKFVLKEIK
ncbi:MAG TPA: hypothetical protein PKK00_14285 [Bacteroidales bacterium]|nr:hypothetical protein [Bacteroidales bacterium]HPS18356.1 hypothetical protein [Bacteroidales bacterium]